MLANTHAVPIIARECVDKHGDLKRHEATIGTGPWMLDSYRPNVGFTFVRNPSYFLSGLPHIERVEVFVDEDNASRMAAFLSGKYDLGWEFMGIINRVDWGQIEDVLKQKRPRVHVVCFAPPPPIPPPRCPAHPDAPGHGAFPRCPGAPGHVHDHRPQGHHRGPLRGG